MTTSPENMELARHHFELGLSAFDQRDYQGAFDAFSQGLVVRPEASGLLLNRSISAERLSKVDLALSDLLAYLQIKEADLVQWHRALKLAQLLACPEKVLVLMAALEQRESQIPTGILNSDFYDILIAGHLLQDRFLDPACDFAKRANAAGFLNQNTLNSLLGILRLTHLQGEQSQNEVHAPQILHFIADLASSANAPTYLLSLWLDELSKAGQLQIAGPSALTIWLANHGDDEAADRLLISFLVERNQIDLLEQVFFNRMQKEPKNVRHMISMAEVCLFKRDTRRAYTLSNAAVSKEPKNIAAREVRVEAFRQIGQPKLALAEIRTALSLDPDNWKVKILEISTLMQLGRIEEADALVQELSSKDLPPSLELDFTFAKTTYLKDKGDYDGLQTFLDEIKPRFPKQPGVNFEQGWLDMANGQFETGFALLESRFARGLHYYPLEPHLANTKIPKLNPQSSQKLRPGQSVLVTCEEGFGDAIQFWRYLSELKKFGVNITVSSGAPVGALFTDNFPDIAFVAKEELRALLLANERLSFDSYVEIMSLPHVLGISHLPIDKAPYLKPNPERILAMTEMLESRFPKKRFRLGLRWQREDAGSTRCIDLRLLAPLANLPIDIVGLHYGNLTEKDFKMVANWENFMHTNLNFLDLPVMMSQLDCVLSVDTVTTHIAGAIGQPSIAMVPTFINWRWGRDLDYSPWYENQMIIRQSRYQSWDDVGEKAIAEIMRRVY